MASWASIVPCTQPHVVGAAAVLCGWMVLGLQLVLLSAPPAVQGARSRSEQDGLRWHGSVGSHTACPALLVLG